MNHFLIFFCILALTPKALSNTISFSELWEQAQTQSHQIQKSNLDKEVSQVQYSRIKWHWTPSLYVKAGYMSTDSPSQSLFANLNQRAANPTTDFATAALNNPETTTLMETTLGIAWPIYEGGKFKHLKNASYEVKAAQTFFNQVNQYKVKSELIAAYSNILNHSQALSHYTKISQTLAQQISRYKVGKKKNPVGYSGLLGLKATLNKVEAFKSYSEAQISKNKATILNHIPNLDNSWEASNEDPIQFVKAKTPINNDTKNSLFLQGQKHITKAMQEKAHSEKSVVRPKVGLFAENSMYSGDRDDANSTTLGAYLKWNLGWYSRGVYREAQLKNNSHQLQAKIQEQNELSGKTTLNKVVKSTENVLIKMKNSKQLMDEQLRVSKRLFRSGAINAIQLSGLYSSVVDLHENVAKTTDQLIQARTQLFLLTASGKGQY